MTLPTSPPSLGDLLYLASYVFRVTVTAVTTMPDTPNQYSAQLQVLGDTQDMNLDALIGPTGPPGVADFVLRDQTDVIIVNSVFELPALTNTYNDIGKYWRLDTLDQYGFVIMETAYVWYGSEYRAFMMGSFGPPGPVPSITPVCETITPGTASYVATDGPTFEPSWIFELAIPQGPVGPPTPVAFFPDVNESAGIETFDVLTATTYSDSGALLWQPLRIDAGLFGTYSMPEDQFNAYSGIAQQAPIGSFAIPPQPFPWTPLVWGHIGSIGGQGLNGLLGIVIDIFENLLSGGLSGAPLTIGCQVLLGDPVNGTQVARGLGNPTGVVNIFPHYSTAANTSASITPTNNYAVVPANHTGNEGTVYINLYNDGANDYYNYTGQDSQLFIAVIPITASSASLTSITGASRSFILTGYGHLTAATKILGTGAAHGHAHGTGTLTATAFSL